VNLTLRSDEAKSEKGLQGSRGISINSLVLSCYWLTKKKYNVLRGMGFGTRTKRGILEDIANIQSARKAESCMFNKAKQGNRARKWSRVTTKSKGEHLVSSLYRLLATL
jgi:hypothetical protein